jgi:hypothetical protein
MLRASAPSIHVLVRPVELVAHFVCVRILYQWLYFSVCGYTK